MKLPVQFPDEAEVVAREAAEFRALTPREQTRVVCGMLVAGASMMSSSPKTDFLRAYTMEQEERARRAIREFLVRHG